MIVLKQKIPNNEGSQHGEIKVCGGGVIYRIIALSRKNISKNSSYNIEHQLTLGSVDLEWDLSCTKHRN